MANVLVEEQYLQDIANSIRTKNGSNDTYTPAEMATAIENITTGDTVNNKVVFEDIKYIVTSISGLTDNFNNRPTLKTLIMPNCNYVNGGALYGSSNIQYLLFGQLTSWVNAVVDLPSLKGICLPKISNLGNKLQNASNLEIVIIGDSSSQSVCSLALDAFSGTKIASGQGYIYVNDSLVSSYKSASNWSTYASQIKGHSELTQTQLNEFSY